MNKKELKHLVFQKALNVLLTKTVAEIYNLVDPGVDTLRYSNFSQALNVFSNTVTEIYNLVDLGVDT